VGKSKRFLFWNNIWYFENKLANDHCCRNTGT